MVGHITLKRNIKRAAGWAAVMTSPFASASTAGAACILMYHRTATIGFVDSRTDDWNVSPEVFERHMRTLAATSDVVPLQALRERLACARQSEDQQEGVRHPERPVVCVTLDDGYASACESALPILERYQIHATFFVAAAYVGSRDPMPFDRWGRLNCGRVGVDSWRAAGWRELERAIHSGLITIGSHSFRHLEARDCGPGHLREEAERSRDTLRARLGPEHARVYAYPYGSSRLGDVTDVYEQAVRAAGYDLAVTTDLGLAHATDNPFRLPRIEAHQVDSAPVLRAKVRGALAAYRVTDRLRTAIH